MLEECHAIQSVCVCWILKSLWADYEHEGQCNPKDLSLWINSRCGTEPFLEQERRLNRNLVISSMAPFNNILLISSKSITIGCWTNRRSVTKGSDTCGSQWALYPVTYFGCLDCPRIPDPMKPKLLEVNKHPPTSRDRPPQPWWPPWTWQWPQGSVSLRI